MHKLLICHFITLLLLSAKMQAAAVNLPAQIAGVHDSDLFKTYAVSGPTVSGKGTKALQQEAQRLLSKIIRLRQFDLQIRREDDLPEDILTDGILSDNLRSAIAEFELIRDNPPGLYALRTTILRLKAELINLINTEW